MNYSMVFDIFRIESESEEGSWYTVYFLGDGTWQCSCPGFTHHGYCKHVDFIKEDQHNPVTE